MLVFFDLLRNNTPKASGWCGGVLRGLILYIMFSIVTRKGCNAQNKISDVFKKRRRAVGAHSFFSAERRKRALHSAMHVFRRSYYNFMTCTKGVGHGLPALGHGNINPGSAGERSEIQGSDSDHNREEGGGKMLKSDAGGRNNIFC